MNNFCRFTAGLTLLTALCVFTGDAAYAKDYEIVFDKVLSTKGKYTHPLALVRLHDGNYAVSGNTSPEHAFWVAKVNAKGDLLWEESIPSGGHFRESDARCLTEGPDGEILVGGSTQSDEITGTRMGKTDNADGWDKVQKKAGLVVLFDRSGKLLWRKAYGDLTDTLAKNYFEKAAWVGDGYVLIGQYSKDLEPRRLWNTNWPIWVVKLDRQGNLLWQRELDTGLINAWFSKFSKLVVKNNGSLVFSVYLQSDLVSGSRKLLIRHELGITEHNSRAGLESIF